MWAELQNPNVLVPYLPLPVPQDVMYFECLQNYNAMPTATESCGN